MEDAIKDTFKVVVLGEGKLFIYYKVVSTLSISGSILTL